MDDVAIRAEKVSKKFCRSLKHTMIYGARDLGNNFFGRNVGSERLRLGEFWAVDNLSFELRRGEVLGIIGPNGSGKSTLLKMLNGIFMPDKGRIEVVGRVGALIEVGAGFHSMLTGRENIYINGVILGMTEKEIKRRFDDIVDFADIGDFLDSPVKHYSSGMYVRLGIAIAIHAVPDILIVDEVLAVGDASFQKKCFNRVLDLKQKGASIIFVSHAMSTVERLCTECLVMSRGRQLFLGNTRAGVQRYFHEIGQENLRKRVEAGVGQVGDVTFSNVYVYEAGKDKNDSNIEFRKDIIIEFDYCFRRQTGGNNQVRVGIRTFEGHDVQKLFFQECPFPDNIIYPNEKMFALSKSGTIRFTLRSPRLFPQTFRLDIAISPLDMDLHLGMLANAAVFNVTHPEAHRRYLEYGTMAVTEFDYDVTVL